MIFKISGQELTIEERRVISEGSINFVTFEIVCDEEWQGFHKTVRFMHEDEKKAYDIPDVREGERYYLPCEVLKKGRVRVGVIGVFGAETVATTTLATFDVDATIEGGRTPTPPDNAFAKYVFDVVREREKTEALACQVSKENEVAEKRHREIEKIKSDVALYSRKAEDAFEKASGILDSVGMALRDILEIEDRMLSSESRILSNEEKREKSERVRKLLEEKRGEAERERRECEKARQSSESFRISAESARVLSSIENDKKISEIKKLINEKGHKNEPSSIVTVEEEFCHSFFVNTAHLFSFSLEAKRGEIGADGKLTFIANSEKITLNIKTPIYSVGDISDTVTFEKDGRVKIIRRLKKITLDQRRDFILDEGDGEKVMFATSIPEGEFENGDIMLPQNPLFTNAFIEGDYLFLEAERKILPDAQALIKRLSEIKELSFICPLKKETVEKTSLTASLWNNKSLRIEGSDGMIFRVKTKKDLFSALLKIHERLDKIESKMLKKRKGERK